MRIPPIAPRAAHSASDADSISRQPPKTTSGWVIVGRIKAGMLVFTVLLSMVACVGLHPILVGVAKDQGVTATGLGGYYMAHPWLGIVLGLPALGCCVPLIRGRGRTMLWMALGTVLALLPLGYLFAGFLAIIVPLYTMPVI